MRAALGAGRERLVRQLITESVVLTLLGGAAGVVVAASSLPLFSSLVPPTLPIASQPGWTCACSAWRRYSRRSPASGSVCFPRFARCAGPGSPRSATATARGGGRKQRVRAVLVTVEVAMSVILLITSGLLIRAVWRVQAIDPGFVAAERADAADGAAAAEVRQPGAPRRVLRSRSGRRARPAGRPGRGVHQRPADGHDRLHHRRRDPRSGRAQRPEAAA